MGHNGKSWLKKIFYWFETPNPDKDHRDNIWEKFHLFNNEWIEIQSRLEWYESPNVPAIYQDHKYIFNQNLGFSARPEEVYYEQNVDTKQFESHMDVDENLPSGNGKLRLTTKINTKSPPSGENDFAMVQYLVTTDIKYKIDKGITFLPRIIARPLNRFFKWAFLRYIGEEMVERDGEYAIERTREYFQYIRKYHGEEPIQTKTRQAHFKPVPEEGIFFQ
jgi:hypothetical protein